MVPEAAAAVRGRPAEAAVLAVTSAAALATQHDQRQSIWHHIGCWKAYTQMKPTCAGIGFQMCVAAVASASGSIWPLMASQSKCAELPAKSELGKQLLAYCKQQHRAGQDKGVACEWIPQVQVAPTGKQKRCLLVCRRSDALSDPEASEEARIDGVVLLLHRPIIWLV